MCGINVHVAAPGRRADGAFVARANAALVHRGPDEGGVIDWGFAALGMRRLSIVDVAAGRQPMVDEASRHALVYNGEIYDHDPLRAELIARGADFHTRSDTEVVLHTLIEHGDGGLAHLNGMFGLAFADRREQTVLVARDALGIKPVYWWSSSAGELVVSSELRSLLEHRAIQRRLDRRALANFLHDRYVADPWTLLEGVRQLPPGHLLRWRAGQIEVERWWRLAIEPEPRSESDALEELRTLLDQVVRSHLVADVPVGLFLSGGIDSSTVSAFATRAAERRLKTFSVGFDRPDYDESALARRVARHIGAEHHELRIPGGAFSLDVLDRTIDHVGQPLGDTSCIPTYAVSKLAAEHVPVVLSGDGGDEFFGGYDHMFWAARVRRTAERSPRFLRRFGQALLAGAAPLTPTVLADPARRARKGLELSFLEPVEQFRRLRSLWSPDEIARLTGAAIELLPEPGPTPEEVARLAPEDLAMQVLAQTFLPGAILRKVDRMSMAASLEVRVPLLDMRIVEFARKLPLDLKVRGRTGKHLLREAGRPLLPDAVFAHKKQGFSLPLHGWFNDEFWTLLEGLYATGTRAADVFDRGELARTIFAGRAGGTSTALHSESSLATKAWCLAGLARWMERFEVVA
jgi:asparagine synthase (glutamine-hydrolysing)